MPGEANAVIPFAGAALAQLDPLHRDRTDPGLNHALRSMAVPHHPVAPVLVRLYALHRARNARLPLRWLGQAAGARRSAEPPSADRLSKNNGAIPHHGVSLLREVQAGFHPPRYAAFFTSPSPGFGHSSRKSQVNHNDNLQAWRDDTAGSMDGVSDYLNQRWLKHLRDKAKGVIRPLIIAGSLPLRQFYLFPR